MRMLFPGTSSARNPIVIVRIFIFFFLWLKVVLQAKLCKGFGGLVQTPANISDTKNYIYPYAGSAIT